MRRILITEDNPINRDMLSRRLQRKGYDVLTAENGSVGLSQATAHHPDLILMDMSMPVMDGWEATRRLKANPVTCKIPVIALTANAMLGDRERAMEAGCDEYEMKPIDLSRLLIKIEAMFEKTSSTVQAGPRVFNLLIVDDNRMNREVLGRRLKCPEYQVIEARSGREAIEIIQKGSIDLVMLDSMMPEMSGLDVLKEIRAEHSIIDLPVIMVTAKEQTDDVVGALEAGANDYVTKPLNFPVVLARIHTQLAVKRAYLASRSKSSQVVEPIVAHQPKVAPQPKSTIIATTEVAKSSRRPSSQGRSVVWKTSSRQTATATLEVDQTPLPRRSGPPSASIEHRLPTKTNSDDTWVSQKAKTDYPKLNGYQILGELGRGGMGVVYKALHQRMNRLAAVKVIEQTHLDNPDAIHRFYREVQAAAQLSHPNIVLAYDAGEYNGSNYFVMEYVEGLDLGTYVKTRGTLTVAEACHCIRQIGRGLQHAHEQGMVHRDIKPSNLLATWSVAPTSPGIRPLCGPRSEMGDPLSVGRATIKILDMGLALLHDPAVVEGGKADLTQNNRVIGTADYMAPEQWTNAHKVDIRADLYSLGCTFYYLLTGEVLFPDAEPMEKMLKHHLDEPTPIEQFRHDVPDHVLEVLQKLMAKKPEHRFQEPGELVDALSE